MKRDETLNGKLNEQEKKKKKEEDDLRRYYRANST